MKYFWVVFYHFYFNSNMNLLTTDQYIRIILLSSLFNVSAFHSRCLALNRTPHIEDTHWFEINFGRHLGTLLINFSVILLSCSWNFVVLICKLLRALNSQNFLGTAERKLDDALEPLNWGELRTENLIQNPIYISIMPNIPALEHNFI